MRDYKYLEDLNLEEVARKTRIEIDCLRFIINKDFARLKRFNLKGFSRILARDYNIDMSSFLEEYQAYLMEFDPPKTVDKPQLSPRMESYAQKPSKFWLWVIGFAAIVALASYLNLFFFLYELKNELAQGPESTELHTAKENIKELKEEKKIQPIIIADIDINSSKKAFDEKIKSEDINATIKPQVKIEEKIEDKKPLNTKALTNKDQDINKSKINEKIDELASKQADENALIFKVGERFWIGTIDLKTHIKHSSVTDKDFILKLDKAMLITTGHAAFSIDYKGVITPYKGGFTKFFIYEDGKLRQIKRAEFMAKNRGKVW